MNDLKQETRAVKRNKRVQLFQRALLSREDKAAAVSYNQDRKQKQEGARDLPGGSGDMHSFQVRFEQSKGV